MKKVTMKDIAIKAGITQQTVSQVLNNYKLSMVSKATQERVLNIARELNYRPNHFAQSLKTGRTGLIGVTSSEKAVAEFDSPYISKIYKGIGNCFAKRDHKLIFHQFQEIMSGQYLELAQSHMVDGLIILLFSHNLDEFITSQLGQIRRTNIPFVIIHTLQHQLPFHYVGLDCIKAGFMATQHLLEHGYDKIGFVGTTTPIRHIENMFTGYHKALAEQGHPFSQELLYNLTIPDFSLKVGYRTAETIIKENRPLPRALFIPNELIAYGMMKRFTENRIRIPEDLAIVGFGDVDDGLTNYFSNLTAIRQPAEDKGFQAGKMLLELLIAYSRLVELS